PRKAGSRGYRRKKHSPDARFFLSILSLYTPHCAAKAETASLCIQAPSTIPSTSLLSLTVEADGIVLRILLLDVRGQPEAQTRSPSLLVLDMMPDLMQENVLHHIASTILR